MSHGQFLSRAIKVCHIAHGDLWAGAEVQLVTLLSSLVRIPGFEFSVVLLNEGRLAKELRRLEINVTVIPERSSSSGRIVSKLVGHLRKNRADIIHTHKYKDNILGAIAGKLVGVPYIIRMVHGLSEPFHGTEYVKMAFYERLDGIMNRCMVKKLVAVSLNIKAVLDKKYGSDKIVHIHNGIDLEKVVVKKDKWEKRRELHVDQNCYLIGTVGRLTPVKGHEIFLEAASLLLKEGRNVKCLLVGDGPLKERLKELAIQLGIEKNVILTGHQDDVYDFINVMDVFVLPSLHEGIPMVLLEALALERPVVASRIGGIPEVIEHGRSGLLVTPGAIKELAQTLISLLGDKHLAESLGKAGRKRVEGYFDAGLMAQSVAQVYRTLVFEGGSR